jgi:hypothetical protein
VNRRELLRALLGAVPAAVLLPREVTALGPRSKLQLAQVVYTGGNPDPRPTGLRRLAWEVDKRTSIDVVLEPVKIRLSDRALFQHPFLFLVGDKAFEPIAAADLQRLRRFLVYGGFLLIDSADARPGGPFDQSVRAMVSSLFPKKPLVKLKESHTIYKSFYLLSRSVGRVATVPYLEGVEQDGRTMLVYCQNDLAGAWSRDNFGQWEYGVYPGGDRQRELAIRWGINLVMYAMCIDYKADQVHIPFILKRRRWQVRP